MNEVFSIEWPLLNQIVWTVVTTGLAYLFGFAVNALVIRRLARLATRSRDDWDDVLVSELRRRIPLWSLLIGVWLSLGYWAIPERWLWFVSRAIATIGVASVTFTAAAIASRLMTDYGRHTPGAPVPGLMRNLVRIVVVTMGLLVILRGFGVEITPMLAALGVGGLAVALALQDPLSNLFSGVFVTLAGQLRIGDYVKTDFSVEGVITDFNWHSTRIQAPSGDVVIVPNARIAKAVVTNFSLPSREVGFAVEVTVAHGSDLAAVERVTLEVAKDVMREVPGGVPAFEPALRFQAFGDLGVRLAVGLRAQDVADQHLLKHEFLKRLDARYPAEGIALARYFATPNVNTVLDR
jgi:small-conductance mechanosensitive channel